MRPFAKTLSLQSLIRPWTAALVVLLALAGAARADNPVTTTLFNFDNVSDGGTEVPVLTSILGGTLATPHGRTVRIRLDTNLDGTFEFNNDVYSGVFDLQIKDPKSSANAVHRDFMCVEILAGLSSDAKDYNKYDATGRVGWLISQLAPNRSNDDLMAGLQIAIWEVAFDFANGNSNNLDSGIFRIGGSTDANVRNAALNFLSLSQNHAKNYNYYYSPAVPTQTNFQDLISTPEPGTLCLLAVGSLLFRPRRSRRRLSL